MRARPSAGRPASRGAAAPRAPDTPHEPSSERLSRRSRSRTRAKRLKHLELIPPPGITAERIAARLGARGKVRVEAARDFRRTLLDRADGVLREQGVSLEWHSVPEGHRLAWRDGPRNPISLPLGPPAPRHATALPEGLLRRRLLESVGHAALLEVVSVLGSAQRVRLMDREDKTVCWVSVERGAAAGHEGKRRLRLHQRVIVVPVKGYGALAARVADHLSEQPGWEASREALFDEAKRRMVRSEATGFAARITSLLQSMEEHRHAVDPAGDPEELHDFRVCLRRVRALFGQIETSSASSSIVGEFKWLGQVSGDARDLDVLAEDLRHALRQECGQYGAVHPQIEALVECRRLEAHRRLGDALASKRYARLLRSARRALRSDALTRKEPGRRRRIRPTATVRNDSLPQGTPAGARTRPECFRRALSPPAQDSQEAPLSSRSAPGAP